MIISTVISGLLETVVLVAFLSLIPIGLAVFFVALNRSNHNKFLFEKELFEQQAQNQFLKSKVEIQESTLRFISREIHDNIGQVLSILKMNLNLAAARHKDSDLKEAENQLGKVIIDLRKLNKSFHPDYVLKDGLYAAIRNELEIVGSGSGLLVSISLEGDGDFDRGEKEVILLRMIQECIQNVVKHAQATHLDIKIQFLSGQILIGIKDDGVGYNAFDGASDGMGLANLNERSKLLDATLTINSKPGSGTEVFISIKNG